MNVPCPNWPQRAWSPLGYHVVEVAEEKVPGAETRRQTDPHAPEEDYFGPEELPETPAVCRFVELALEEVEAEKAARQTPPRSPAAGAANRWARWEVRPLARWGAVAAGAAVLLAVVLAVALRPRAPDAPLLGGGGLGADDGRPVIRETFGSAVGFVRSPAAAARAAAREQKLLCLLHVSGSFEEARFT